MRVYPASTSLNAGCPHSNPSCYRQPLHQRSLNVVRQPSYAKERQRRTATCRLVFQPPCPPPTVRLQWFLTKQEVRGARQNKARSLRLSSTVYFSRRPHLFCSSHHLHKARCEEMRKGLPDSAGGVGGMNRQSTHGPNLKRKKISPAKTAK
jgi:hypothetical protein